MVDENFFFHFFDFSIEKMMMKICLGVIRFQIGGFFEKKIKKFKKLKKSLKFYFFHFFIFFSKNPPI